jgi:hypothetical protein
MSTSHLVRVGPLIAAFLIVAGVAPGFGRTINLGDRSRHCLSTSIVPSSKARNAAACVARNSCDRAVFATFDAYPLHSRRSGASVHVKVSHWLKPGDNEVFGWDSANPAPAPECNILETHF